MSVLGGTTLLNGIARVTIAKLMYIRFVLDSTVVLSDNVIVDRATFCEDWKIVFDFDLFWIIGDEYMSLFLDSDI